MLKDNTFQMEQILTKFHAYQKQNCYLELQKGIKSSLC